MRRERRRLLSRLVTEHQPDCWLLNTGWTGGPYGTGKRMPLSFTRTILRSVLDGSASRAEYRTDPNFDLKVPLALPGVPDDMLSPRSTWPDRNAYDKAAATLLEKFTRNFSKSGITLAGLLHAGAAG